LVKPKTNFRLIKEKKIERCSIKNLFNKSGMYVEVHFSLKSPDHGSRDVSVKRGG